MSNNQDGDSWGVYAQRYDASGNKVATEFQINTHTSEDQSWSGIVSLPNGGLIVTWGSNGQDGDSYGIYGQRFSSTAATVAVTTLDFSNKALTEGDRVTLYIAGGTQVQAVVGSGGLDELLTSMSRSAAL